MTLDLEALAILQKAAIKHQALETTGLEITEEIRAAFERIKLELASAPVGSTAFIVEDVHWGKYDALIAATEKAHGPVFGHTTLQEMEANRRAQSESDLTKTNSGEFEGQTE